MTICAKISKDSEIISQIQNRQNIGPTLIPVLPAAQTALLPFFLGLAFKITGTSPEGIQVNLGSFSFSYFFT